MLLDLYYAAATCLPAAHSTALSALFRASTHYCDSSSPPARLPASMWLQVLWRQSVMTRETAKCPLNSGRTELFELFKFAFFFVSLSNEEFGEVCLTERFRTGFSSRAIEYSRICHLARCARIDTRRVGESYECWLANERQFRQPNVNS